MTSRRQGSKAASAAGPQPGRRDPRRSLGQRDARVDVTGHPKPAGGLVPFTGPIPIPPPTLRPEWLSAAGASPEAPTAEPAPTSEPQAVTAVPPAPAPAPETVPTPVVDPAQRTVTLKDEIFSLPS